MATIASLNVNLGMNTAGFTKDAKHARATLTGLSSSLAAGFAGGGAVAGLSVITTGIQSLASTAQNAAISLGHMIGDQLNRLDDQADFAQQLGVSVTELGKLEYAARLTDSSVEDLRTGVDKFQVSLSKALQGDSDNAFAKLGLDANELSKVPLDDALGQTFDALNKFGTATESAALRNELFGKSSRKLQNTISAG